MSKINELIQTLCPDGVEYKKLDSICGKVQNIKWEEQRKLYVDLTSVDRVRRSIIEDSVVEICKENAPSRAKQMLKQNDILFGGTRPTLMRICMFDKDSDEYVASTGFNIVRVIDDNILPKFVYYCMTTQEFYDFVETNQHGGSYPAISDNEMKRFMIPVPPRPVQDEIVRILDEYTDLEAELEAKLSEEIELKQKQYEYYRDNLLTFGNDVAVKRLGDISFVTKLAGFEFTNYVQYQASGKVIALRGLNVKNGKLVLDDIKYIDGSDFEKLKRSKLFKNDLLYTYVGTVGQVGLVDEDDKYYLAPNVALIRVNREEELSPQYLTQFLLSGHLKYQLFLLSNNSTLKNITMTNIREFQIPVPSLTEQERIVEILDKYDTYTRDMISTLNTELESRKKQYSYYRDQLLTFKRKE